MRIPRAARPSASSGLVVAEAGDQQAGGLEVGEHLAGARRPGSAVPRSGASTTGSAAVHSSRCRSRRLQGREHLAGHAVGDAGPLPGIPGGGRDRVRRGTDGARGEHDGRAPALGARRDRLADFGVGRPGVLDDQRGRFFVVRSGARRRAGS